MTERKKLSLRPPAQADAPSGADAFLDALAPHIDRNTRLELVRNDGQLYVTIGDTVLEGTLTRCPLLAT